MPVLDVHGRRNKAFATRNVGSRHIVIRRIQIIAMVTVCCMIFALFVVFDWRGSAVQGSGGLIVQVLQSGHINRLTIPYFISYYYNCYKVILCKEWIQKSIQLLHTLLYCKFCFFTTACSGQYCTYF